jgi:hypothetical protein
MALQSNTEEERKTLEQKVEFQRKRLALEERRRERLTNTK